MPRSAWPLPRSATGESRLRCCEIQNDLFDLGADVATPGEVDGALRIVASQVERLEGEIDAMNASLEPLTSFILPSGSPAVAALHLARASSAAPSGPRSRSTRPSRSTRTCSLTSTACRTICSSPRASSLPSEGGDVLWQPGATRT